jgi:CheY-like chemotaxis protein
MPGILLVDDNANILRLLRSFVEALADHLKALMPEDNKPNAKAITLKGLLAPNENETSKV